MCGASFDHPVIAFALRALLVRQRGWFAASIYVDTIKPGVITFDPAKSDANVRKRGLAFSLVKDEFDWASAVVVQDTRKDYGERRYRALGFIGARLHAVVYTPRSTGMHIISLRKANRREEKRYAAQKESATR